MKIFNWEDQEKNQEGMEGSLKGGTGAIQKPMVYKLSLASSKHQANETAECNVML